jgi:hypothetical protein
MNCTEFDYLYDDIVAHVSTTSQIFWISTASFSFIFSILMIFTGEKLFRPASVLIAGLVGLVLGYMITTEMGYVKCYIKLIVAGVFALVLSIAVSCLLKAGMFLLGGAAFGTVAHYSFEIIPEDVLPNVFAFQNKNGLYWIVVGCSGLIGAIIALIYKKKFMRLATSLIGGSGISLSIYILCFEIINPPVYVHPGVFLGTTIVLSFLGYLFQRHSSKKRNNKITKGIEKEVEDIKNINKNKIDKRYIEELLKQTQRDAQIEARESARIEVMREMQRNKSSKNIEIIEP